jgi:hypothetical protein
VTAEALLIEFWEWRKRGRAMQTLDQDLELFLTPWQAYVGWKTCSKVYLDAKLLQDWDIQQGGRPPDTRPCGPSPPPRRAPREPKPSPKVYFGKPR